MAKIASARRDGVERRAQSAVFTSTSSKTASIDEVGVGGRGEVGRSP